MLGVRWVCICLYIAAVSKTFFAPGTELISLSIALRGVSTRKHSPLATTVAVLRRPAIRPISPKNEPFFSSTTSFSSSGLICTLTRPSTIEKTLFVYSFLSKITSPACLRWITLSIMNSRNCSADICDRSGTFSCISLKRSLTFLPGRAANFSSNSGSSAGGISFPEIVSTTS